MTRANDDWVCRHLESGLPQPQAAAAQAAARALRIALSATGASAASPLTSRDTSGSEATGPNSSGWARSTATSARQSPPATTATARSVTIFPGSCTVRGAATGPARRQAPVQAGRLIVWVSSNAPASDTIPEPSGDTVIFGRATVIFI